MHHVHVSNCHHTPSFCKPCLQRLHTSDLNFRLGIASNNCFWNSDSSNDAQKTWMRTYRTKRLYSNGQASSDNDLHSLPTQQTLSSHAEHYWKDSHIQIMHKIKHCGIVLRNFVGKSEVRKMMHALMFEIWVAWSRNQAYNVVILVWLSSWFSRKPWKAVSEYQKDPDFVILICFCHTELQTCGYDNSWYYNSWREWGSTEGPEVS